MDKSVEFTLLAKTRQKNAIGVYEETVTERTVYGQVGSVSASEFFAGGQAGFKPEYRVRMFAPDYEGEDSCKIGDETFSIYRTYLARTDEIELYLERRAGNAKS